MNIEIDLRDELRPGDKFYYWEKLGACLRLEIGPRDMAANSATLVRRDTGKKMPVAIDQLPAELNKQLEDMQKSLYQQAQKRLTENTVEVDNWDDFKQAINDQKFVMALWDGTSQTEEKIKQQTKATIRCLPFSAKTKKGQDILSGQPAKAMALFAKAY